MTDKLPEFPALHANKYVQASKNAQAQAQLLRGEHIVTAEQALQGFQPGRKMIIERVYNPGAFAIPPYEDVVFYPEEEIRVPEVDPDLGDCPYYRGTGICGYHCTDEPSCQTEEPEHGWPSAIRDFVFGTQTELELDYPRRRRTIN